jgi:hypothetical protein
MQYYQREGYPHGYSAPLHPVATARMQWPPHPGQWGHLPVSYDFYHGQPGGYSLATNQPSVSSPDHAAAATPHNIRDILGAQQQQNETLASEVAKTPSYQKSPTSAAAIGGTIFHYPSPQQQQQADLRSPTTPGQNDFTSHGFYLPTPVPGRPFGKLISASSLAENTAFTVHLLLNGPCYQ